MIFTVYSNLHNPKDLNPSKDNLKNIDPSNKTDQDFSGLLRKEKSPSYNQRNTVTIISGIYVYTYTYEEMLPSFSEAA